MMENSNNDKLFTEKEASEYLNMKIRTLSQWRYRFENGIDNKLTGPVYVKIGGAIRYRKSDIEAYISDNRVS